jgi:hypothetical protein
MPNMETIGICFEVHVSDFQLRSGLSGLEKDAAGDRLLTSEEKNGPEK